MKRRRFDVDRKLIDLSVGWLKGQVSYTQFCKAINKPVHSNAYIQMARALRVAYRSNLIK